MPPPLPANCPACNRPVGEQPVYCMECGRACHRECFEDKGGCAVPSCTGLRFRETPRGKGVNLVATRKPDGTIVPRQYCVDYTSARETWSLTCGLLLLFFGVLFGLNGGGRGSHPSDFVGLGWGLGVAGAALIGFRFGISDYRVVDGRERVVWNYRKTFGYTHRSREASFDHCRGLALVGRPSSRTRGSRHTRHTVYGTEWSLTLLRARGAPILLTDREFVDQVQSRRDTPPGSQLAIGRNVARIVGVELEVRPPR